MLNFLLQVQGSPIEARKSGTFLYVMLVALIIFVIVIIIGLLYSVFKRRQKAKDIDPNRKTTMKDIERVALKIEMNQKEKDFLYGLCQRQNVKNLYVNMKNYQYVNEVFEKEYKTLTDDNELSMFFELRTKFDLHFNKENTLSSTESISVGQLMAFLYNNDRYLTSVRENTKEGLILEIPKNVFGDDLNIPVLERIDLVFSSASNSIGYKLPTRIVRYQNRNEREVVVAHSNKIEVLHRRRAGRLPFNADCTFQAVKVVHDENKKNEKPQFNIMEKSHRGKVTDISAHGIGIQTELPIKKNQYMHVELKIFEDSVTEFIGIISGSEFNKYTEKYTLHVKFVDLDLHTQNKICSLIYDYEKANVDQI